MKYTLIQTYPGYETLGITHCSENKTPEWRGTNFYDAHPKYWQKVEESEEVDYEITEVMYAGQRRFLHEDLYRIFIYGVGFDLDYLLKNEATIFSVKRLSDGEVFTIGDKINFKEFGDKGFQPIERFEIDCFYKNNITAYNSAYGLGSLLWEKQKTPLFTTEDGVEIFEGDRFSAVQKSTFIILNNCIHILNDGFIGFSTKEKAEEYILLNKPCLSLNDLFQKFFPTDYDFKERSWNGAIEEIHTDDLIELAESKL